MFNTHHVIDLFYLFLCFFFFLSFKKNPNREQNRADLLLAKYRLLSQHTTPAYLLLSLARANAALLL